MGQLQSWCLIHQTFSVLPPPSVCPCSQLRKLQDSWKFQDSFQESNPSMLPNSSTFRVYVPIIIITVCIHLYTYWNISLSGLICQTNRNTHPVFWYSNIFSFFRQLIGSLPPLRQTIRFQASNTLKPSADIFTMPITGWILKWISPIGCVLSTCYTTYSEGF